MQRTQVRVRMLGSVLSFLLMSGGTGVPQVRQAHDGQIPPIPVSGAGVATAQDDAIRSEAEKKARLLRQEEQRRKLMADSEQLLAMATELKADMDKASQNTLSIEMIKKTEAIEKLAKSMKGRMKNP